MIKSKDVVLLGLGLFFLAYSKSSVGNDERWDARGAYEARVIAAGTNAHHCRLNRANMQFTDLRGIGAPGSDFSCTNFMCAKFSPGPLRFQVFGKPSQEEIVLASSYLSSYRSLLLCSDNEVKNKCALTMRKVSDDMRELFSLKEDHKDGDVTPQWLYSTEETPSDLRSCDFRRCIFRGANLREAVFDGSDLTGAIFQHADVTGASFKNCQAYNETDKLYPIADFRNAMGLSPEAWEDLKKAGALLN